MPELTLLRPLYLCFTLPFPLVVVGGGGDIGVQSERQQECRVTAFLPSPSPSLSLLPPARPISNRRTRLQIGKLFFASFAFFPLLFRRRPSSPYQRGEATEHDIERERERQGVGEEF